MSLKRYNDATQGGLKPSEVTLEVTPDWLMRVFHSDVVHGMVRLHLPFHGVSINEGSPVASADKVLFRCPTCTRTFRVPVAYADMAECPECAKLSAANKAAEHVERDAFRQERVEQWAEKDQATQKQRAKRSLGDRQIEIYR